MPETSSSLRSARTRGPGRPRGKTGIAGRAALLRAARELMAEKGLPRFTLREVAVRAGVKPTLVHYHFGSKSGLVDEVLAQLAAEAVARVAASTSARGTPRERLASLVRNFVLMIAGDPYLPRLIVEMVLFPDDARADRFVREAALPNLQAVAKLLAEGAAAGDFREVDVRFFMPQLAGIAVHFFLSVPLLRRALGIEQLTPEMVDAFADSACKLVLDGITRRETGA